MRLQAFILISVLVTAGCVEVVDPTSGTNSDDPVDVPAIDVTFNTNWLPDRYHYLLKVNVTDLPEGFSVVVREGDHEERFEGANLTQRLGTTYDVPATHVPEPGDTVVLEAYVKNVKIASREIHVDDGSSATSRGLTMRATYTGFFFVEDTAPDAPNMLRMNVTLGVDATPERLILTSAGAGHGRFADPTMQMTFTETTVDSREVDGALTKEVFEGKGTWSYDDGAGSTGSGTIETTETFISYGVKRVDGNDEPVRIVDMRSTMAGDWVFEGEAATMVTVNESRAYYHNDTQDLIWIKGTETTTFTMFGETNTDAVDFDGPAPGDEEEKTLMDATDWTGLEPSPVRPGDKYQLEGLEDLSVSFVARTGDEATYAGQTFATTVSEGTITGGGATGTEVWTFIGSGSLEGAPLSLVTDVDRGTETARAELTLKTIA